MGWRFDKVIKLVIAVITFLIIAVVILVSYIAKGSDKVSMGFNLSKKINSHWTSALGTEYTFDVRNPEKELKLEPSMSYIFQPDTHFTYFLPSASLKATYSTKIKTDDTENKFSLVLSAKF